MGDVIKAIEFLGMPTTIAIGIVILFLIMQIIGELAELMGKVVPEILKIRKYFIRKKKEKEEAAETLNEVTKTLKEVKKRLDEVNSHYDKDNITKRNNWMNGVNTNIEENDKFIHQLDKKVDKLLDANTNLQTKLEKVEDNVLTNEADRLRSELFDCGNRCRRNIRLHPEEMEHIRAVFHKYSNVLHQNGTGENEFEFITDYYNHQDFPTYHTVNNTK